MTPEYTKPKFSILVAIAQNMAIGKNNDLLWHISADLKQFKHRTLEHAVIMGRNTYDSLPIRPFPNRRNIVITRNSDLQLEGCEIAHSIQEAITLCQTNEEHFIIGGAHIYEQFLPIVDTLYITWVYKDFEADRFFPKIDENIFKQIYISERFHDEKSNLDYAYSEYARIC